MFGLVTSTRNCMGGSCGHWMMDCLERNDDESDTQ